MEELARQNNFHKPVYNIKAVSRLVGLLPVTLRAWERRYGLPIPLRGDQGYRLYSEYDLRILRWLKAQIDAGLSIGRAVDYLHELQVRGEDPVEEVVNIIPKGPTSLDILSNELMTAFVHFDETQATEVVRRAFTMYSVDQVLTDLIQRTLVEIGESWHSGELPIAVEHYATQFCTQHLLSMQAASMAPFRPGTIIAACAPGEMHQIGLMMIVVMLRWRGWDVRYLGPNMNLDRLEEALAPIHPRVLMFSASGSESAQNMLGLREVLKKFPGPAPLVVLGGQAFQNFRLPDSLPAVYFSVSPTETVEAIERLMKESDFSGTERNYGTK